MALSASVSVPFCLRLACLPVFLMAAWPAAAQHTAAYLRPALERDIRHHESFDVELRKYLLERVAAPPAPQTAADWRARATRLRGEFLERIFHGWPREWRDATPRFDEVGVVETGSGYRIRKLLYEVVPGYVSTALLYEPARPGQRVPAVLNVHGHDTFIGKAADYKQKRCIAFARQGMFALSLEWIGTGELHRPGNEHAFGAHLDLVGLQEVGVFYLLMRQGLDYLSSLPAIDPERIAVTGLSGGGWQTILLGALDERVKVAVPVSGFSSLQQRLELGHGGDIGDMEQAATDLFAGRDYSHLVALRAPRPTLLVYSSEDDCCFRPPLVKPLVFDAILPVYRLLGAGDGLQWYVNDLPGSHNYQKDIREQAYGFIGAALGWPLRGEEDPAIAPEVRSVEELRVGIPKESLTLLGLARHLAARLARSPLPPPADRGAREGWIHERREALRVVVRYEPVRLARAWGHYTIHHRGIDATGYLFQMQDGLSAPGVWLKRRDAAGDVPATLVVDDRGPSRAAAEAADRLDRGEQVLVLNLLFTSDPSSPTKTDDGSPAPFARYINVLHGIGERALGVEAAHLIEAARWLRTRSRTGPIRLETRGIRSQVVALTAAALEPEMFSELVTRDAMRSLGHLLDRPVPYAEAPDLFCLDLYKAFDIDALEAIAGADTVRREDLQTKDASAGERAPSGS